MDQNICEVCIMDDTDPDIVFYGSEGCNHCIGAKKRIVDEKAKVLREGLEPLVARIKEAGKGNDYDCLMGISGGVDSSYVGVVARELGLRVLAVHMDNGWNSELTVQNIENVVRNLGIDLITHVVDWEEIKDLQRSYLQVPLMDVEVITDHAVFAVLYHEAAKHNVKYILSGSNVATETIMPLAWAYDQRDLRNIVAIHKRYGKMKLSTFPMLSAKRFLYYIFDRQIKFVPILNYVPYVKPDVVKKLQEKLGWRPYPQKHGESVFTRFFQDYYLPTKFGIDKRKAHLSSMIAAGDMTRNEALSLMNVPLYRGREQEQELDYILKKLDFTREEWNRIMSTSAKRHEDFPNNAWMFAPSNPITKRIKKYAKAA